MKFLSVLLLLQRACPTSALSFGKADEVTETVGFVREDNQRDTISLLLSCFATLALCVYSAVHLNVPRKRERHLKVLFREFKWCVIGLFAPELILYTAWRQLASARQLCLEINNAEKGNSVGTAPNHKVLLLALFPVPRLKLIGCHSDQRKRPADDQKELMDTCTWLLRFHGRVRY